MAQDPFEQMALDYHRHPVPGKVAIVATKRLSNQRDLALAYSPGVAVACNAIVKDPGAAAEVTGRANLVAVVTNGTAVLGLGAIGPLAAKPVMEGKAVLFKRFANIDVFDIELAETDPDKLVDVIAALEPTFGAINLEDIKAPECFLVERNLRTRMRIPVFHDDQHGTAIVVGAGILNGLAVVGKKIADARLVCCGAGAAALACLDLLVDLGLKRENILVYDLGGVVHEGRTELMDPDKARYARPTSARTLPEILPGADIFLGLSGPGALKPEWLAKLAPKPLIFALANPTPEILPEEVKKARPDAIVATGRSDYPNQVNNVLCFPFIFRGALDAGATSINREMEIACVHAIAALARAEASDVVAAAYGVEPPAFGPEYLIPRPFDPRLIVMLPPAVAEAAMRSGVATRPIADFDAYRQKLAAHVYRTGFVMRPVFERARKAPQRIVFAEGEDQNVLRAVQIAVDEGLAKPILVGRRSVIEASIARFGLRMKLGAEIDIAEPQDDARFAAHAEDYYRRLARRGVTPAYAKQLLRSRGGVLAAMMVLRGEADGLICGVVGQYDRHLARLGPLIGLAPGVKRLAAMQVLVTPQGLVFVADTNIAREPDAEAIAEMTVLAAQELRRFGLEPKVALLSHADFGAADSPSAQKMRVARAMLVEGGADFQVEGEMRADAALNPAIRNWVFPDAELDGPANLLIMPNLDAASIAFGLAKELANGLSVGPILLGAAHAAHIVLPTITVRGLVNMTALASVDAQARKRSS
jgi:malate dehydrogenase (oxaloacetate-decarboxylating)(NADP+)